MDTKMWEFSIFFSRELLCYFEDLKNDLKEMIGNQKNCVSISLNKDYYVFMLALTNETYKKIILFIKERIAEIILLYYKPKTIIDSINNFDIKSHDNVILIDILSSFEFDVDKDEIVKNLSLIDKLYLESFVKFKLINLTKKWSDVSALINQNSLFLLDDGIKKELMQFLMDGIKSNQKDIKLVLDKKNIDAFYYENSIKKTLKNAKLYYSIYDYDNLLFSLIKHYPQKIEVEHYKDFDVAFIQNLADLFGMRLKLID